MAMTKCKECKQEVSSSAKTCPHCGAADPALTAGGKLAGCGITVVAFLAICYGIGSWMFGSGEETASTASSTQAESQAISSSVAPAKSLGMNLQAYESRINLILDGLERPYRLETSDITRGQVNDVLKSPLGNHASLLATMSKSSGEIIDIAVIGHDIESPEAATEILLAAGAALTAAAPGATTDEVFAGIPKLLNGTPLIYENVKLSAKRSDELGNWFFAQPL